MGHQSLVLASRLASGSRGGLGLLLRNRNPMLLRRGQTSIAAAAIKPLASAPTSASASASASRPVSSSPTPHPSSDSGSHPATSSFCPPSASSLNNSPALRPPPMASSARSADSSDISTPRSTSPSPSLASARSSHRSSRTSASHRVSISSRRLTDFNPMSSVDVSAIEEAMKLASLDQHRGYAQDHYSEVKQDHETEPMEESEASGYQVIREPLWNKGRITRTALSTTLGYSYLERSTLTHILPLRLSL